MIMKNHTNCKCKISPKILNSKNIEQTKDFGSARFIRFLKQIGLKQILSKISDPRQKTKITYSSYSLLLWALSVFFFRQGSKNSLQTSIESLPDDNKSSLLHYFEIDSNSIPNRSTVDDYIGKLNVNEINQVLIDLFHRCQKNKVFYNHSETLLPNNNFHLGGDGLHIHTYDSPHSVDENGNNNCPYCLPRVLNKGKDNEITQWIHMFVTFILIFPSGFELPIYVYPLKAEQIKTSNSNEELKQECELTAFYEVLPKLREKLGRIKITVLLDSLYANEPVIKLINELRMSYFIVRKEASLKKVGSKCDELEKTDLYKKFYQKKRVIHLKNGCRKEQLVKWFNKVDFGKESFTNVIRFQEVIIDKQGKVINNYKNEWLSQEKVTNVNCFNLVNRARMRFGGHEDTHNTLKNRGFNAEHDYARSDYNKMIVWKLLMFIGAFISEVFNFTKLAQEDRGTRSLVKFARDLLQQLIDISWDVISRSNSLQKERMQFRFKFVVADQ